MDGLRGLAAVQVVLLHYATAFLPGLVMPDAAPLHYRWEAWVGATPLFLPLNGFVAVFIFFVMSGTALTLSLERHPAAPSRWTLGRVVRLGWPMAASIALAAALNAWLPHIHTAAADLTGSAVWLGAIEPPPPTAAAILHQVALEGMFAGYRETSLLPGWAVASLGLQPLYHSYNALLWTLHVELVGSLLVLVLVRLRPRLPPALHAAGLALLAVALSTSPLLMFLLGYLAARSPASRQPRPLLGLLLVAGGVALCSNRAAPFAATLLALLPRAPLGPATTALSLQFMLAAALLFAGLAMLPRVRQWLSRPALRWLGRISFSLYLVHFPVLFTISSGLFVVLLPRLGYGQAVAGSLFGGGLVTVALAIAFERGIDRPAIRFGRLLGRRAAPDVRARTSGAGC